MTDKEFENLKIDYENTVEYIFHLSDIRFKLLGFLPLVTGIAFSYSDSKSSPENSLILGILGLLVTIGILFYDQRNTEIYNRLVSRSKKLEREMGLRKIFKTEEFGGTFNNRPGRARKFLWRYEMWHDKGLAIVYSAVIWVWLFIIFASVLTIFSFTQKHYSLIIGVISISMTFVVYKNLLELDKPVKFNYAKNTDDWEKWCLEYKYGAFYIFPPKGIIEPINKLRATYDPKSAAICCAHISLSEPLLEPLTQMQIEELQRTLRKIEPFKIKYGPLKTIPPYPGVAFDIEPKKNFSELREAIHSTSLFADSELKRKDTNPHITIAEFISIEKSEELKNELQGNVATGSFVCDSIQYAVPNDEFYFERVLDFKLG